MLLSTFNVFFRDLQQLVGVVIMLLFYLIPIVYPIANVPPDLLKYVVANPLTPIFLGYQAIFYDNKMPSLSMTAYALFAAIAVFLAGRSVFNRYKDAFADYV
jgi:ABC-type polysaccharide/polyol phosphate export permease